jgi:hypothetical protein
MQHFMQQIAPSTSALRQHHHPPMRTCSIRLATSVHAHSAAECQVPAAAPRRQFPQVVVWLLFAGWLSLSFATLWWFEWQSDQASSLCKSIPN